MAASARQHLHLIFDADDTLWDSNVHFLETFDEFVAACTAAGLTFAREAVKDSVRRAELDLIQSHGYGREPYVIALRRAAAELAPPDALGALSAQVERIGRRLVERHCELFPGVAETLAELAGRHRLLMFTKGQRDEQLRKLRRSGLDRLFSRVETPREKDVEAYRRLVLDAELHPERTWMIGNSPRSDINPAVRAGLRAVYIPHPHTWELEHEELARDERIIEIDSFRRLVELF
jgi:putative hydrolase of the HAD superfamily